MFDDFCVEVLDPVEDFAVAPSSSEEPAGLALHQLAVGDCVFAWEKREVCTILHQTRAQLNFSMFPQVPDYKIYKNAK